MAKASINTFGEFKAAVAKQLMDALSITDKQAEAVLANPQVGQLASIGFNIRNTPKKVAESLCFGIASSAIKRHPEEWGLPPNA
jgi:hypothetical protein